MWERFLNGLMGVQFPCPVLRDAKIGRKRVRFEKVMITVKNSREPVIIDAGYNPIKYA